MYCQLDYCNTIKFLSQLLSYDGQQTLTMQTYFRNENEKEK